MSPNTLHYNFSHTWKNVCESNECASFNSLPKPKAVTNNLYDVISKEPTLTKTTKIIQKGNLENHFKHGSYTLFVTEDINIPDAFVDMLDYYNARKFIMSYTIKATGSIEQLFERGDAVYESSQIGSPILSIVDNAKNTQPKIPNPVLRSIQQQPMQDVGGTIVINKVGKVIRQIHSSTGNIIVMNNIANVL
jgi:hypothetical protein